MAANRLLKYIGTKGIGSYIENTRSYTQETLPAADSVPQDTKVIVDGVTKRSDGTNWVVLSSATTPASPGTYSVITVNDTGAVIAGRQLTNNDLPLIDASKITGTLNIPVTGNADTATKLLTSRTISTTGDGTWAVAFDGSNNATGAFTLSNSGATAGTYTKVTVDAKGRVTTGGALSVADIPSLDAAKITSGTLTVGTSGNAGTSTKLATARTISATGDGTWSVSFDGSANATGALTLSNSGAVAGTYQNVTVNAKGLVTAGTNLLPSYTVSTLPSGNTGARYRLSDVNGIATYNNDRYYMDLSARTWASLNSLSKTGLVAGATCKLTDFNYQEMVYDGTSWRPAQGRLLIAQASWDGTTPLSSVTGAVSGVFYAPGSNVKIPAGLIGPGATVVAEVGLKKTGANGSAFFGLSLSTYDGSSAQGVSATINATINNADNMDARWAGTATFATSTTQFIASTFLVGGTQGVGGYVLKNTAVNTAADMYLVPWCAAMNAADVVKLLTYRYWIEF